MRLLSLVPLLLAAACQDSKIGLGGGSPVDARLYADMYTWECQASDTGGVYDEWEGVFAYNVSLEYAPDELRTRAVPSSGCSKGLDLFPTDAGGSGVSLGTVPGWSNGDLSGTVSEEATGFYIDDVFNNRSGCSRTDELLGEGTLLSNAGSFSGARTPAPGSYTDVTVSSISESGLPYGEEVEVTWDAADWDTSWVQIRRENGDALVESVTCTTEGETSYTIGEDVWSLFNSAVTAEYTNLYVAVERSDISETDDGQKIQTVSRAMHVGVIQD